MKKIAISLLLVAALVISAMAFTANAQENIAPNDVSAYAAETMDSNFPNSSGPNVNFWCPVCNKSVTWESYGVDITSNLNISDKHYYLNKSVTNSRYYIVDAGKSGCLYLNGCNITSSSIVFETNGGTINVIGNGNELIKGYGYGNLDYYGDVIHTNGGTANLFGGVYEKSSTDFGPMIGAQAKAYTLNVYEGTTIRNGYYKNSPGGAIYAAAGSKIGIHGGTISGSQAGQGGNIYVTGANSKLTVAGGTISGGVATGEGGNIYVGGGAALEITGGTITGGSAVSGGNVYVANKAWTMSGGEISGGTSTAAATTDGSLSGGGGNVYAYGAAPNISGNALISGGTAVTGGNMYVWNASMVMSGGTITGGTASGNGGTLFLWGANLYPMSGGTITGGSAKNGGTICAGTSVSGSGCVLNITGGTINGGTASVQGGNIFLRKGSMTVNGDSAAIVGGTSGQNGGNLYLNGGTSVTLTKGSITGGAATGNGGTACVEAATLNINGGIFGGNPNGTTGGTAVYGGSIYLYYDGVAKVAGGTVANGQATSGGGNVCIDKGTLEMTSGKISNGSAKFGGAVYVGAGDFSMSGGTMENGQATGDGGNLHVASGAGTISLTGGTISGGKGTGSGSAGGNIFAATGKLPTLGAVTIQNGSATHAGAGFYLYDNVTLNGTIIKNNTCNLMNSGTLTIDGACNMEDIIVVNGKVHVKDTFTGTAWLYNVTFEGDNRGAYLDATKYTCDGPFLGTVKLYSKKNAEVCGTAEGKLIYGMARLFDKSGNSTWCGDVADAIKKWNANSAYIVPNTNAVPVIIPAGATAILNLNGDNITNLQIGEGAKVYVYDVNAGSNRGYISLGSIATDKVESFFVAPDGYVYVAVTTDGVTKMHRVEFKLSGVTLRPGAAGMYYTAELNTSAAAKALLNYGVAMKAGAEVGSDLTGTSYTQVPASNATTNGVLVSNILTSEKATADRANTVVYAKAYVEYNGKVIMSEGKGYSLTSLMEAVNTKFASLSAAQQPAVASLYNTYATQVGWDFANIKGYTPAN